VFIISTNLEVATANKFANTRKAGTPVKDVMREYEEAYENPK
jgi:hypothetical protein